MSRFTSSKGIELIKKFEGFSDKPYLCSAGHWTIGYGHKMTKHTTETITIREAEQILKADLLSAEIAVLRYINIALYEYQFDALVSFTYNCGNAALQRSTLRQKVNYQSYTEARKEFLRWVHADGKKIAGLVQRRIAESRVFSGELVY